MSTVLLKVGGTATKVPISPGDEKLSIEKFLFVRGLPPSLFIPRSDGSPVQLEGLVRPGLVIEAVKELDLTELSPFARTTTPDPASAVSSKKWLEFDYEKNLVRRHDLNLDRAQLTEYVERTIFDTIKIHGMIDATHGAALALSGGKDSMALLSAMASARDNGGPDLLSASIAVTVEAWGYEQANTYSYARHLAKAAGLEHVIVGERDVERTFRLSRPFAEVYKAVADAPGIWRDNKTLILAQIQRRMVEVASEEAGVFTLVFGLNLEDLLSEIVLSMTTAHLGLSLPVRDIGQFRYVYPLAFLRKRDISLYLEVTKPGFTSQETVQQVERGSRSAHHYIAMAAWLTDLWPGIEYQMFEAYKQLTKRAEADRHFRAYETCGATMVVGEADTNLKCFPCETFSQMGFA